MKTVQDLQKTMYSYNDVGVAMQIQGAIANLIKAKNLSSKDELSITNLEKIRQEIYQNNRKPDPFFTLFGALAGKSTNPVEAALQYIEKLQKETR